MAFERISHFISDEKLIDSYQYIHLRKAAQVGKRLLRNVGVCGLAFPSFLSPTPSVHFCSVKTSEKPASQYSFSAPWKRLLRRLKPSVQATKLPTTFGMFLRVSLTHLDRRLAIITKFLRDFISQHMLPVYYFN